MSDSQALVEIIGIFIIALMAAIAVTAMTWRATAEIVKDLVSYVRTVPERVRLYLHLRRDPDLRRDLEAVAAYENAFELIVALQGRVLLMEEEPTKRPEARERRVRMAREALLMAQRDAVACLCGFDDFQLAAVATHVSKVYLEDKVSVGAVFMFLADEQLLLSRNAHEASRHVNRIVKRFGPEIAPAE